MVLSEVYHTFMISIAYDFVEDESCNQESKLSHTVTGDSFFFLVNVYATTIFFHS